MKIQHENYDQVTVLSLRGDLVAESVDEFRRQAVSRFGDNIRDFVLDFEAVDGIDSKGLESLLWLQDECGDRLGQVRLAGLQAHICKILELTRLEGRFDAHPDVETAIRSLR